MRTNRFLNKTVLALVCLALMQVMPVSVSAAPTARPLATINANVYASGSHGTGCFLNSSLDFNATDRMNNASAVTKPIAYETDGDTSIAAVTGVSSANSCSLSLNSLVANSARLLPMAGFSTAGANSGLMGGLFILVLMLSSVLAFGMTVSRNNKRGGRNNNPLLLAGGLVVILVVMLLLALIGVSLINKARTAPVATGTAVALNPTAVVATLPGKTDVPPTQAPLIVPPTIAPTLTDVPSNTPLPSASPVPTEGPPFQPVGDKSFFMPRLQIPGGAVGLPITELPLVNSTWNVNGLGHIVGHLEQTSWLGDTGNTVLVAHIQLAYNDYGPFLRLGDAQIGDLVYVSDHGKFYTYQVVDIKKVNPTDVQVTYPTPNPILTLITCTNWDAQKGAFAQRLVVTAKLIKSPDHSA